VLATATKNGMRLLLVNGYQRKSRGVIEEELHPPHDQQITHIRLLAVGLLKE
jgi:hypothetical protein